MRNSGPYSTFCHCFFSPSFKVFILKILKTQETWNYGEKDDVQCSRPVKYEHIDMSMGSVLLKMKNTNGGAWVGEWEEAGRRG